MEGVAVAVVSVVGFVGLEGVELEGVELAGTGPFNRSAITIRIVVLLLACVDCVERVC